MPVLDFVFIGPGRSGTTYIDSILRQDDRIALPQKIKETNHFLTEGQYSEDRFWRYFATDCDTQAVRGEVANMYIYDPMAISNLTSMGDQLTLHAIMRNPFDRLVSSLRFRLAAGEITEYKTFEDALERYPDLISQSAYATLLRPYLKRFGHRLKIYFFEDLMTVPENVVGQFYANIGLDAPNQLSTYETNQNMANSPRSQVVVRFARFVSDTLRRLGLLGLLGRIKDNRTVTWLIYSDTPLEVEISKWPPAVVDYLNDEIDQLSLLLGRDLSHWRRTA